MKNIIITILIIAACLLIPQGIPAQSITKTVGTCLNETHVQYTTTINYNGQNYVLSSPILECSNRCMNNSNDFGDDCEKVYNSDGTLLVIWLFIWGFLLFMYKFVSWKKFIAPMMLLNALGGVLITQSVILLIPIAITTLLTLWTWKWLKPDRVLHGG